MLALTRPDVPPARGVLDTPGGFSWWYADIVNNAGDALVLIGAWGLPFLPGYAAGARVGNAGRAGDRPSLNLALYRGGKPAFYLLHELDAGWESAERWRFGDSVIESRIDGGERLLTATVDCPVAGSGTRMRGTISVRGPARRPGPGEGADGVHRWTPLAAPARGEAQLAMGDYTFRLSGRAYHDRNECAAPIHTLGIGEWLWGRAPLGDREVVWYLLWPEDGGAVRAWGLTLEADGETRPVEGLTVRTSGRRRSLYGLAWWDRVELVAHGDTWLDVSHGAVVEDGPFYLRFLPEVVGFGARARGVAELVRPDRVDLDWMRPFVKMRVRPAAGAASMWLPLFEGPAAGKIGRLWSAWTGGTGE